jgi:hypothetical protein
MTPTGELGEAELKTVLGGRGEEFDFLEAIGKQVWKGLELGLATQSRRARSMAGPALAKRRSWWSVMPWFPIRS